MKQEDLTRRLPRDRVIEIRSVTSFAQKVEDLREQSDHPTTFRGQLSLESLFPSLTRAGGPGHGAKRDDLGRIERMLLDEFRRRLPRPTQQPAGYWETAVLGRHHGLPTRLLDWTELPIVALFFAVAGMPEDLEQRAGENAAVVGTRGHRWFLHELGDRVGGAPWDLREDAPQFFVPDFRDERIFPQRSVLSVWRDPLRPFEEVSDAVWCFVVPGDTHRRIRRELDTLGITDELLFPGLDATARYLAWKTREYERG